MLALAATAAAAIAGCPAFPFSTDQRVDRLPVAPDSAAIVRSIGIGGAIKADFGSGTSSRSTKRETLYCGNNISCCRSPGLRPSGLAR